MSAGRYPIFASIDTGRVRHISVAGRYRCRIALSLVWKQVELCRRLLSQHTKQERRITMLYTIAVVMIILWLLGLVSSYTMGGFIHVLLIIAVVMIVIQVIQGRSEEHT